jgi:hypothetical protein
MTVAEIRGADDKVFIELSSATTEWSFFQVLTFDDGRIVLIKDYDSRRKALRAAGLS